jgi:hypothetical protein
LLGIFVPQKIAYAKGAMVKAMLDEITVAYNRDDLEHNGIPRAA